MSTDDIKNEELEQEINAAEAQSSVDTEDTLGKTEEAIEQEMDEQEQEIIRLQEELAAAKDSLLRKAAELENVRKRVQRERAALYEIGRAHV